MEKYLRTDKYRTDDFTKRRMESQSLFKGNNYVSTHESLKKKNIFCRTSRSEAFLQDKDYF